MLGALFCGVSKKFSGEVLLSTLLDSERRLLISLRKEDVAPDWD
jgi:hypothetical protein